MRRVPVLGGLSLLLLVGVLAVVRQQEPMPPWIYFERDGQLHRVTWDGKRLEVLSGDGRLFVDISPDGRWLLSIDLSTENWLLSSIDLSKDIKLPRNLSATVWSPDRRFLALAFFGGMFILDVQNRTWQNLDIPVLYADSMDWSPDGEWLLFNGQIDGLEDLFRIRHDGTDLHSYHLRRVSNPVWSPDGNSIAFSMRTEVFEKDVFVMQADGSKRHNLTTTPDIDESTLKWDDTGEWIFFTQEHFITKVHIESGTTHRVIAQPLFRIDWYGNWMVYSEYTPNDRFSLFRYNYETREMVQLTDSQLEDTTAMIARPADLPWHPETLALITALIFGVTALTRYRRRRADHHIT